MAAREAAAELRVPAADSPSRASRLAMRRAGSARTWPDSKWARTSWAERPPRPRPARAWAAVAPRNRRNSMRRRRELAHTGQCAGGAGGARCAPPAPPRARTRLRRAAQLGAGARAMAAPSGGTRRPAPARPAAGLRLRPRRAPGARRKGGARRVAPAVAAFRRAFVQPSCAAQRAVLVANGARPIAHHRVDRVQGPGQQFSEYIFHLPRDYAAQK